LPGPETTIIYTRHGKANDVRAPGRLKAGDLPVVTEDETAYICGSSPFADAATDLTTATGIPPERIRIERFGPTG
jgi:ferredoxin-NADP reductase